MFGTPVSDIPLPKDRNIYLKDILMDEVDEKYYVSDAVLERMKRTNYSKLAINPEKPSDRSKGCHTAQRLEAKTDGKTNCLTSVAKDNLIYSCLTHKRNEYGKSIRKEYEKGHIEAKRSEIQNIELREDGKTNTLTTVQKDNLIYEGRNSPIHIPEATKKGYAEIFPGECFDATQLGSKTRRGRKMTGKCNCLMAQAIPEYYRYEKRPIQLNPSTESNGNQPYQQNRVYSDKGLSPAVMAYMSSGSYAVQTNERIRRLTPTECARLQTIPEWYKWECSETQQYKMLGNGWTVEVIKHIFSFLPENLKRKSYDYEKAVR